MLREYDKPLTKAAIHQKQQYLDKSISSIKVSSSKEITIPSHTRQAAIFIRNWIRNILRRNFKLMLSRHMMKRACWRLVKSQKKRNMEWAFLMIRQYISQNKLQKMHRFYDRLPELRILACICRNIFSKPQRQVFQRIRAFTLRKKNVMNFTAILVERCEGRAFSQAARHLWSSMVGIIASRRQKQVAASQIVGWLKWRRHHLLRNTYCHIFESVKGTACFKALDEWQGKKQKIKSNEVSRKEILAKLKEQMKEIKPQLQQQKQDRYKIYNEHKKKVSSNKVQLLDMTRKHEKVRKEEQSEVDWLQEELDEWERILASRKAIAKKHQNISNSCYNTYKKLGHLEQQFRGIQNIIPSVQEDVANFRQSENYYFLSNLCMSKLVELYQKRDTYNYQAQYYELQYQNKVVRQTIRCFVRGQYESYINAHRRDERKMSMSMIMQQNNGD